MLASLLLTLTLLAPPLPESSTPLCRFATIDRVKREASTVGGPLFDPNSTFVTRLMCIFRFDEPSYTGTVLYQDTEGPYGVLGTGGLWVDPSGPAYGGNPATAGGFYIVWDADDVGREIHVCARTAPRSNLAMFTDHGCGLAAVA